MQTSSQKNVHMEMTGETGAMTNTHIQHVVRKSV